MDSITIAAIAIIFGLSFIIMIVLSVLQKKKKKVEALLVEENQENVILHIYGHKISVDGRSINELDYRKGTDSQFILILPEGKHEIQSKFAASSPGLGGTKNYKTPKPILCNMNLTAGVYSLGLYFYSPEERYNYYSGDVEECVYSQKLRIENALLKDAYIICYRNR